VERVPGNHRHHDVQLELSCVGRGEDRCVASHDLEAHLIDHFRYRRIDLAGHDRRARLHRGKLDFRETGPRSHAEQPQIRRDFADFDREAAHRPGTGEHVAHALGDPEPVVRRSKGRAGFAGQTRNRGVRVVVTRVEARADGGCAEVQFVQLFGRACDLPGGVPDVRGESPKLLAERDGHRILQVRATGFQNV
jgi:hypothetical protein